MKPRELITVLYCYSSYGYCEDTNKNKMVEVDTIVGAINS